MVPNLNFFMETPIFLVLVGVKYQPKFNTFLLLKVLLKPYFIKDACVCFSFFHLLARTNLATTVKPQSE